MNQKTQLAPGCLKVGGVAVHVAVVRDFTADIERFKRDLPLVERIEKHEPGSPEWHKTVAAILDENPSVELEELAATMAEAAEIHYAAAGLLRTAGRGQCS